MCYEGHYHYHLGHDGAMLILTIVQKKSKLTFSNSFFCDKAISFSYLTWQGEGGREGGRGRE